jgi:uncharacterized membrane protein YhaH (DUF805 family)
VTFSESVSKCFRKYATFKGRASRSEYWRFTLLAFLVEWPLLLTEFESGPFYQVLGFMYFILTLAVIIPSMAVWTRRMHDIDKSGWSWLLILIPIIGFVLIIKMAATKGDENGNKYGDPDNGPYTPVGLKTSNPVATPEEPIEVVQDKVEAK